MKKQEFKPALNPKIIVNKLTQSYMYLIGQGFKIFYYYKWKRRRHFIFIFLTEQYFFLKIVMCIKYTEHWINTIYYR